MGCLWGFLSALVPFLDNLRLARLQAAFTPILSEKRPARPAPPSVSTTPALAEDVALRPDDRMGLLFVVSGVLGTFRLIWA